MPSPARIAHLGRVDYVDTARLQRSLRAARHAGATGDLLLLLEHDPVITTGTRTEPHEVAAALAGDVPVVPTERGGKATWHGPGQVVAYPIVDLRERGSDVRAYVRSLEAALIDTLADLSISAARRDGYPGVWVGHRKVASIGVRLTQWVTFHGVALNVDCDLASFAAFTPCGIGDVEMTSVARELGEPAPATDVVRDLLECHLVTHLGLARPVPATPADLHDLAAAWPVAEPDLRDVRHAAHHAPLGREPREVLA